MKKVFGIFTVFLVCAVIFKFPFFRVRQESYEYINTRVFKTITLYINFSHSFWGITNIFGNTLPFFVWGALMKRAYSIPFAPCFFLSSFIIVFFEIAQYIFRQGTCDIDDVLLNSLSSLLGIVLVNFYEKRKLD